jgi:hypothetical protein
MESRRASPAAIEWQENEFGLKEKPGGGAPKCRDAPPALEIKFQSKLDLARIVELEARRTNLAEVGVQEVG